MGFSFGLGIVHLRLIGLCFAPDMATNGLSHKSSAVVGHRSRIERFFAEILPPARQKKLFVGAGECIRILMRATSHPTDEALSRLCVQFDPTAEPLTEVRSLRVSWSHRPVPSADARLTAAILMGHKGYC